MNGQEQMRKLPEILGIDYPEIAAKLGKNSPQSLYHIRDGRNGLSDTMANAILKAFPQLSRSWLILNEGNPIKHFVGFKQNVLSNTELNFEEKIEDNINYLKRIDLFLESFSTFAKSNETLVNTNAEISRQLIKVNEYLLNNQK